MRRQSLSRTSLFSCNSLKGESRHGSLARKEVRHGSLARKEVVDGASQRLVRRRIRRRRVVVAYVYLALLGQLRSLQQSIALYRAVAIVAVHGF
jgi:hypothetical protein